MKKGTKCAICILMSFITAVIVVAEPVRAATISDIQKQKEDVKNQQKETKKQLNSANSQVGNITGAQDNLGEEIEDIDQQLVDLLTDIKLIDDSIEKTKEQIDETQKKYDAAVEQQKSQYNEMKVRVRYMYEQGNKSYVEILMSSYGMQDALNKADYVSKLYSYDRTKLAEYEATVKQVADLKESLEEQQSELEASKSEKEDEQKYLDGVEKEKQSQYDDYDVQLAKAKQAAAAYSEQLKQQTDQISQLQAAEDKAKAEEEAKKKAEEEAKKKAEEAKNNTGSSNNSNNSSNNASEDVQARRSSASSSVSGSGSGADIAKYACNFIGNPYVPGGTSLTNGADCSGFVQAVYSHFGYSLPRNSFSQSQVGEAVSYDQAQAGDVIYYGGHVAIYLGNGMIVHASTQKTGIKTSVATYRPIITVRHIAH